MYVVNNFLLNRANVKMDESYVVIFHNVSAQRHMHYSECKYTAKVMTAGLVTKW